jgi:hypothetical protein
VGLTPRNNVAWKKVVTGAMTIGVFMCLCMGLAGYLSFRSVYENKKRDLNGSFLGKLGKYY